MIVITLRDILGIVIFAILVIATVIYTLYQYIKDKIKEKRMKKHE